MKVNKYEPTHIAGIAERWPIGHDSRSQRDGAFKDFHRGAITKPTGQRRTIVLTPVAVLGFTAMLLLFIWFLVNIL